MYLGFLDSKVVKSTKVACIDFPAEENCEGFAALTEVISWDEMSESLEEAY